MNVISSKSGYFDALLQIEAILLKEFIPYIEGQYRISTTRENRMLSGFSMVGAMAFYYEVKYPELFGTVTSYAGTYHHLYHKGSQTVGESSEKAFELYNKIFRGKQYLYLVSQNADKICDKISISIHFGMNDILF